MRGKVVTDSRRKALLRIRSFSTNCEVNPALKKVDLGGRIVVDKKMNELSGQL